MEELTEKEIIEELKALQPGLDEKLRRLDEAKRVSRATLHKESTI